MKYVPIEDCLDKSLGDVYKLAVMVAVRAQELADGASPMVAVEDKEKPLNIALREIAAGLLEAETEK
mgnify:CR=1 FL=1